MIRTMLHVKVCILLGKIPTISCTVIPPPAAANKWRNQRQFDYIFFSDCYCFSKADIPIIKPSTTPPRPPARGQHHFRSTGSNCCISYLFASNVFFKLGRLLRIFCNYFLFENIKALLLKFYTDLAWVI